MKIASKQDLEMTRNFLQFMQGLFDNRYSGYSDRKWEDIFEEDSEEYELLKRKEQYVSDEECRYTSCVDNRLVLYEAIREMYKRCDINWQRVVWAADILIDNCCDPSKSHLDWHPYIERAMDNGYFGE